MIKKILCFIGIHNWYKWEECEEYKNNLLIVYKKAICKHCGRPEFKKKDV